MGHFQLQVHLQILDVEYLLLPESSSENVTTFSLPIVTIVTDHIYKLTGANLSRNLVRG